MVVRKPIAVEAANLRSQLPLIRIIADGNVKQRNQVLHKASPDLVAALATAARMVLVEHRVRLPRHLKHHASRAQTMVSYRTAHRTKKKAVSGSNPREYTGRGGSFFGWLGTQFKNLWQKDIVPAAEKVAPLLKEGLKVALPLAASMAPAQYKVPATLAANAIVKDLG